MTGEDVLAYCLAKPGAWQDEPWEGDVVAKVGDKIFAFLGAADGAAGVGVKCGRNRDEANEWLARFPDDASVNESLSEISQATQAFADEAESTFRLNCS